MKIKLVTILLFLLFIITCSERNKGFKIIGNAIGFKENATLYLEDFYAQETIDSTRITNGEFSFSGQLQEPTNCIFRTKDYSDMTMIWIDNSKISIEITKGNPKETKIFVSKTQHRITEFQNEINQLNIVLSDYSSCKISQEDSLSQQIFYKEKDSVRQQIDKKYVGYIEDNPNDYYSAYLLSAIIERIGKKQAAQLYNTFLPEVQKSNYGTYVYRYIRYRNELKIGARAKNFGMRNAKGDIVYLNDFKGNFLLLSFWIAGNGQTTRFINWDGCFQMNQELNRLYGNYHSNGLNILSVSLDRNKQDWLRGIKRDDLIWHNVCDFDGFQGIIPITYNIKSVPTVILLGPDMYVVETDLQKIEDLLDRIY